MDDFIAAYYFMRNRDRRRSLRIQRRTLRDRSNPFELPEERFIELFRFPQAWVVHLIDILTPHMAPAIRGTKIPIHIKVLAALTFYGTGSYQRTVGEDYHLGIVMLKF